MFYRYMATFLICFLLSGSQAHAWSGGNFWGQGGNDLQIYYADKKIQKKNYPNPHRNPKIINNRVTDLSSPNLNDNTPSMVKYNNNPSARSGGENYRSLKR